MGTIGVTRCLGDHDLFVYDSDIWIKPFLSPLPEVCMLITIAMFQNTEKYSLVITTIVPLQILCFLLDFGWHTSFTHEVIHSFYLKELHA